MAYQGDDRFGGDRWRERGQDRGANRDWGRGDYGRNDYRSDYERGGYRQERGRYGSDQGRGGYERGDDDRGFIDRAGDELRSWFGDEEAQRRREEDNRRWEREQRMTGRRTNADTYGDYGDRPGGGWGNQQGASWHRDRPGERGWFGASARDETGGRGFAGSRDDDSRRYGTGSGRYGAYESGGPSTEDQYGYDRAPGGMSGFGGAPDTGSSYTGFGGEPSGFGGRSYSSGREAQAMRGDHDPHYSQWRQRQLDELDRDYHEYRQENQTRFEQEFGNWRSRRQTQRQSLTRVSEHMEVVGSDGSHVGTVDKVRGDRIILARNDPASGGIHHSVPCSWVEGVDDKVTLNKTAQQAMESWRNEDRSRALFEREDSGSDGPHALNRSFAGTYKDRDDRDDREDRDDRTELSTGRKDRDADG